MLRLLRSRVNTNLLSMKLWRRKKKFVPVLLFHLRLQKLKSQCVIRAQGGFPHSFVGKESTCNAGDSGCILELGRSTGEGIDYPLQYSWASLVAQLYRILLWSGSPGFDPWVRKIPCRRERIPTPVFWPGKFHGLYSPSGRKESDSTERLSLSRPMLMSFCAILFIEGRDPILFIHLLAKSL